MLRSVHKCYIDVTDSYSRLWHRAPMPITPFLKGENFDQESTRVMGVALEIVCAALRTGDCADLALLICEQVLKDIRQPQMEAEPS